MKARQRYIADFETRSIMLFSAVLVSMVLVGAAKAQAPAAAPLSESVNAVTLASDAQARMRLSSAQVQQAFQHIDSNRDGRLTRSEVSVYPRVERHFERIDANRDGTISPVEFEEALQQAS